MDIKAERQFLSAIQFLLRLNAGGALEYLLHETGYTHYCLLRNGLVKRCKACGNPGCAFAGKKREFDIMEPATGVRIIE